MSAAETDLSPLAVALARASELAPDAQLSAMNRVLDRNPALKTSFAAALAEINSGETLVAAMHRENDPTSQSLALLVVTDVDPAAATSLFASIDARFKAAMDRCVATCLAALPETSLAALASARDVQPSTGPAAIARLTALYDTDMYRAIYAQTASIADPTEGQRIFALLQPPPDISTPAWLVGAALREDVKARTQDAGDFLAVVRANQVPWPAGPWFAARPELASTAGRIEVLVSLADEPTGRDIEHLVRWLIHEVADARDKAIDRLLATIARDHADLARGEAALVALAGRKGAVAREALVACLIASDVSAPTERELRHVAVAVRGLVTLDPSDIGALARHLTPEAVATPFGRCVSRAALGTVARLPSKKLVPVLEVWASVAVALLDGPADDLAREVLKHVPAAELSVLLSGRAKPPRGQVPVAPRWLERYEAGEHEAVWRELRDIGPAAFEIEDAARVAAATMRRVKENLERIVAILRADSYPFAEDPLPGPSKALAKDLAAIEKAIGSPLPLSFRAFHEIVGPVDLRRHPTTMATSAFNYLSWSDPLQVAPSVITREFVASATKASKRTWPEALRLPARLMFAMSPSRKGDSAQPEDGAYELEAFGHGADGVVRLGGNVVAPFVEYLRAALERGGFAGIDRHEHGRELRTRLSEGRISF